MRKIMYGTLLVYAILSLIFGFIGLIESAWTWNKPCEQPTRMKIIVPAYYLGCYLGEPLEE